MGKAKRLVIVPKKYTTELTGNIASIIAFGVGLKGLKLVPTATVKFVDGSTKSIPIDEIVFPY